MQLGRLQILVALIALTMLGGAALWLQPDYAEGIVGACVAGILALGLKILESK